MESFPNAPGYNFEQCRVVLSGDKMLTELLYTTRFQEITQVETPVQTVQ